MQANYERKPLEEMNALADEEEMIDEDLDEKDHPIAVAAVLEEQLTEGKDEADEYLGGSGDISDDSVEVNEVSDKDENSEDDLDKLLDEELDDLNIGTQSGCKILVRLLWLDFSGFTLVIGFY